MEEIIILAFCFRKIEKMEKKGKTLLSFLLAANKNKTVTL